MAAATTTGSTRRRAPTGRRASSSATRHRLQVARNPSRRIGLSTNSHDAQARAIDTPASISHSQGEVGPGPVIAPASAITGQCHR